MLHLQGLVGYDLARLEMAEQQRTAARRELGRLARALGRRAIPTQRETSPMAFRFPWSRHIADHPGPVAI